MTGSKTTLFADDVLDYIVGRTPAGHSGLPAPTTAPQLALFTTMLSDSVAVANVGATECSGNAYARVAIVTATHFNTAAASGSIQNDGEIAFPQASGGGWGNVRSWALVEGGTAGAPILCWCTDPDAVDPGTGVPVNDGDTVKFAATQITITET